MAMMYGIIRESSHSLIVANRVFEIVICDYFISKDDENNRKRADVLQFDIVKNGIFEIIV